MYVVELCLDICQAICHVDISIFGKHIYSPETVSVPDMGTTLFLIRFYSLRSFGLTQLMTRNGFTDMIQANSRLKIRLEI